MLLLKLTIIVYFCLKHMVWKHTAYHVDKSDIGHIRLKQKQKKNRQTTFVSMSKNSDKKNKSNNKLVTA